MKNRLDGERATTRAGLASGSDKLPTLLKHMQTKCSSAVCALWHLDLHEALEDVPSVSPTGLRMPKLISDKAMHNRLLPPPS